MRKSALIAAGLLFVACSPGSSADPAFKGQNYWFPGYVGVPGFAAKGFGPAGYPGVQDDSIDNEPVQQFLASVLLQPSDLPDGTWLALLPKGNLISQPTFSVCELEFVSELTRLVRRAVQAVDVDSDPVGVLAEAVQHESAEAATIAMDELRQVAQICDDASYVFFDAELDATNLVSTENLAVLQWLKSDLTGAEIWLQIWQQRGNTIVSVQISEATNLPLAEDSKLYAVELAELIAKRLADANPLDIGELE